MALPEPVQTGDLRLGPLSRAWRAAVVLMLAGLFCAGSLVGDDPWWPFSPWRMFSTSQAATGSVISAGIEVQTARAPGMWVAAPLTPENVGLNRAEIEGRIPQIVGEPARLGTLAVSHSRLRPDEPAWTALRVVRREIVLEDRRPTGEVRQQTLAQWSAG